MPEPFQIVRIQLFPNGLTKSEHKKPGSTDPGSFFALRSEIAGEADHFALQFDIFDVINLHGIIRVCRMQFDRISFAGC